MGFKVVVDHFEFSAIVKPLVNQYVVPLAPTRVCQNSAAGGFDKPPRLMSRPTVRSEDSLSALLFEAVSVYTGQPAGGHCRGRPSHSGRPTQ